MRAALSKDDYPEPKVWVDASISSVELHIREDHYAALASFLAARGTLLTVPECAHLRPSPATRKTGGASAACAWWRYFGEATRDHLAPRRAKALAAKALRQTYVSLHQRRLAVTESWLPALGAHEVTRIKRLEVRSDRKASECVP